MQGHKNIKHFINSAIDKLAENITEKDRSYIFLLCIANILKQDRFIDEYKDLSIYHHHNKLNLFFNYNLSNKHIFDTKISDCANNTSLFLPENLYNTFKAFEKILINSVDSEEYIQSMKHIASVDPDFLRNLKTYTELFNPNHIKETLYLPSVVMENSREKKRLFNFSNTRPSDEKIELSYLKENMFKGIEMREISTLEKAYKKYTDRINQLIINEFPTLFLSKRDLISNAECVLIKLEQADPETQKISKLRSYFGQSAFNIEDHFSLKEKGLSFLNASLDLHTGATDSYIIVLRSKDGEVLGGLSYGNKKGSIINDIRFVFTNNAYRGLGVATKLYSLLAKQTVDEQRILFNSSYTELGERFIPKICHNLKKEYPSLIFLEMDHKEQERENLNAAMSKFDEFFLDEIKKIEKERKNIPMSERRDLLKDLHLHHKQLSCYLIKNMTNLYNQNEFLSCLFDDFKNDLINVRKERERLNKKSVFKLH